MADDTADYENQRETDKPRDQQTEKTDDGTNIGTKNSEINIREDNGETDKPGYQQTDKTDDGTNKGKTNSEININGDNWETDKPRDQQTEKTDDGTNIGTKDSEINIREDNVETDKPGYQQTDKTDDGTNKGKTNSEININGDNRETDKPRDQQTEKTDDGTNIGTRNSEINIREDNGANDSVQLDQGIAQLSDNNNDVQIEEKTETRKDANIGNTDDSPSGQARIHIVDYGNAVSSEHPNNSPDGMPEETENIQQMVDDTEEKQRLEIQNLNERLKRSRKEIETLQDDVQSLTQQLADSVSAGKAIAEKDMKIEKEIHDLKKLKSKLQERLESKIAKKDKEIAKANMEIQKHKDEIPSMKGLESKIAKKDKEIAKANMEIQKHKDEISSMKGENAKQAANLQRLTYQFNQTKQEKDSYFQQIQVLSAEKRDLLLRLSKVASANMTYNNPNIADLSDEKRPTKLAEDFSELYDNEWTDAFEEIEGENEKDKLTFMLELLMRANQLCLDLSNGHTRKVKQSISTLTLLMPNKEEQNRTGGSSDIDKLRQCEQEQHLPENNGQEKGNQEDSVQDIAVVKAHEVTANGSEISVEKKRAVIENPRESEMNGGEGRGKVTVEGHDTLTKEARSSYNSQNESESSVDKGRGKVTEEGQDKLTEEDSSSDKSQKDSNDDEGRRTVTAEGQDSLTVEAHSSDKHQNELELKTKSTEGEKDEKVYQNDLEKDDGRNTPGTDSLTNTADGKGDDDGNPPETDRLKVTSDKKDGDEEIKVRGKCTRKDKLTDDADPADKSASGSESVHEDGNLAETDNPEGTADEKGDEQSEQENQSNPENQSKHENQPKASQTCEAESSTITEGDEQSEQENQSNPENQSKHENQPKASQTCEAESSTITEGDEEENQSNPENQSKHENQPKASQTSEAESTTITEGNPQNADMQEKKPEAQTALQGDELEDTQISPESDDIQEQSSNDRDSMEKKEPLKNTKGVDTSGTSTQKDELNLPTEQDDDKKKKVANGNDIIKEPKLQKMKLESDFEKLQTEQKKTILEATKFFETLLSEDVKKAVMEVIVNEKGIDDEKQKCVVAYIAKSIDICWSMLRHEPPVHVDLQDMTCDIPFDTNKYKPYTKTGKHLAYIVWPALYLHEGGPLLSKGVAQGK